MSRTSPYKSHIKSRRCDLQRELKLRRVDTAKWLLANGALEAMQDLFDVNLTAAQRRLELFHIVRASQFCLAGRPGIAFRRTEMGVGSQVKFTAEKRVHPDERHRYQLRIVGDAQPPGKRRDIKATPDRMPDLPRNNDADMDDTPCSPRANSPDCVAALICSPCDLPNPPKIQRLGLPPL